MATSPTTQVTDFTRDVIGRYICNGFDEALQSTDQSLRPDARPFDIIVIGGGSFGPVFAQHLFASDKTHSHRILILDGGPFVLPEHFQNLPFMGFGPPGPVKDDPGVARAEIWGLPWLSDVTGGFPGLAYGLGGRSLFFGGWSPQLLDTATDSEMPRAKWPPSVVDALNNHYFATAAAQIGVDQTNDFVDGELHRALRQQLFDGLNTVTEAMPTAQLPVPLWVKPGTLPVYRELAKLEAPLAVQSKADSGLFPFNKFSSVPLLMKAARQASIGSQQGVALPDDVKKRLMIVPFCRVIRLNTVTENGQQRVSEVQTSLGNLPVSANAKVVIALGTIESTRLALLSFQGVPNYSLIGQNLMAHLRSNLTIRIPRTAINGLNPAVKALQSSALFVKGKHVDALDGRVGYFHLQITASGLNKPGTDSEAELFKKIPDYESVEAMHQADDQHVVITIRGIGETEGQNPGSLIRLANDRPVDEVGVQRAFVTYHLNDHDLALWAAMDKASDEVAKVFANGLDFTVLKGNDLVPVTSTTDLSQTLPYLPAAQGGRRDGMGTTHHEAGPLWMGTDAATSVTDANGKFHQVTNAYVAGPALFPTVGSPNPMLTGVALAQRLADQLTTPRFTAEPGFTALFDGADLSQWRMSTIKNQPGLDNPGTFLLVDGALESLPGSDLGLFWHTAPTPPNFILKLEFLRWRADDNSGLFVRFPNPESKGYNNTAYVAINFGFEVQIDEVGQGNPAGQAIHKTGAIYSFAAAQNANVRPPGEWNQLEVRMQGQDYTVFLNGDQTTHYVNPDPVRGTAAPSFIGLQTHTGRVAFRKIQLKELV